ncbi:nucleolar protein 12-like [Dysidea avara]|uniref:nucleolar protein 12-like n=1 Tax=Dysidea avara TaxID=196820 RepID=UPI0033199539
MGRTFKNQKAKKLIVSFDEEARRDYLTGFSRRKRLRKKYAKQEEVKKEEAKKKEKRAEKKTKLRETMMRYNLLDESSTNQNSSYSTPEPTNATTQYYKDTKVTISDIPGFESRYNTSTTTSSTHISKTDEQALKKKQSLISVRKQRQAKR